MRHVGFRHDLPATGNALPRSRLSVRAGSARCTFRRRRTSSRCSRRHSTQSSRASRTPVRHERRGGIEKNRGQRFGAMPEMEKALWNRPAGGGSKPPQAAPVKCRSGERCGKRQAISLSGESRGDERKRTNRRHVEIEETAPKPGGVHCPGKEVGEGPADCPDGVRRKGGVTSAQARAWNVGTRLPMSSDRWSASARTPRD